MSKERRYKGKKEDQRGRKGGSHRSNSGRRSEKRESKDNKTGCFRCGDSDHLAAQCPTYKERSTSRCRDCRLDHPTGKCKTKRQSNNSEIKKEEDQQQQIQKEAQRLFMKHFDVSREVSEESSNYNNIKDDSFPICMSGECASFYKNTNPNDEFNSCSFNNSKVQDKKLSSHSSLVQEFDQNILESGALPNKEYFAQQNWELYSEDKMKYCPQILA